MGLLDLFSKERTRERNANRAINKFSQSPDRLKALQSLASDGSPEAIYGLLRRFGMMVDKTIDDEQEKEWVFDTLVAKGGVVLEPLKKYLLAADSIAFPLRLLDKIVATKDEVIDVIAYVMERHPPGYERDPTKKMQLLTHLGALKHGKSAALCAPYLKDMDEGVRYTAVEALLRQKNEAVAREPLLELFTSDAEESLRIRIKIAEGFAELGWLVQGFRPGVEKKLPDAFALDREGHIKKKQQG